MNNLKRDIELKKGSSAVPLHKVLVAGEVRDEGYRGGDPPPLRDIPRQAQPHARHRGLGTDCLPKVSTNCTLLLNHSIAVRFRIRSAGDRSESATKQCCGSGMFIQDPGSLFVHSGSRISDLRSRIPDLKTAKERGENKLVVLPFCSHKYHKIVDYFNFELVKKKNYKKLIIELSTTKVVIKF